MTERPAESVRRSADHFQIGPSALEWTKDRLIIDVNERSFPGLQSVKGTITVIPEQFNQRLWWLDADQDHSWGPIALNARIEVALTRPDLHWQGHAYFDQNEGRVALNQARSKLKFWNWSRAVLPDQSTVVIYDVQSREDMDQDIDSHSAGRLLGLRFTAQGDVQALDVAQPQKIARTGWGMQRSLRSDSGQPVRMIKALEDTPFYSRNLLEAELLRHRVLVMHESLDVSRLGNRLVQCMLPVKMPRWRA